MPADSPRNAIARQWELLKRLPSGPPGKSAGALAQDLGEAGYDVSKRTVERDLRALENLFPLAHGDAQPYDWHWIKGGSFSVPGLSLTDALSLHLLERFLKPLLPAAATEQLAPAFKVAATKLEATAGSNAVGNWSAKVAVVDANLPVVPAPIDVTVLGVVKASLLADEQIEVDYVRSDAQALEAETLCPLGLVQCGPVTYLVAAAPHSRAPRLYAMHRMRAARRLHVPFAPPHGFSLHGFIADGGFQFGDTRAIRLQAWVSPMLALQLADTRLSADQQLEPADGGFMLMATLNYSWRLRWWLLSKTGDIHVIAPTEVRDEVARLLSDAAARYAA
jgi:predicted DNA-binding transcriptional regulator YafY